MNQSEQPLITIVSGHPSDEEIAALAVVLAAAGSTPSAPGLPPVQDNWGRPTAMHRGYAPFSPTSYGALPTTSHSATAR